jgi:hypothetical protein
MQEATTVCPLDSSDTTSALPGLQDIVNNLDPSKDFERYIASYFGEKTEVNEEAVKPFFGVSLDVVIQRDGGLIPLVLERLINAIETPINLSTIGIYRLSGNAALIQKTRSIVDKQIHAMAIEDITTDLHVLTGLLKLYFRELPDSLFPRSMYYSLIEASREDDEGSALMKIHEMINELPDASYATLRALMKHLHVYYPTIV